MERAARHESANREEELVRRGLPLVQYVTADVAARVPRSVPRDDLVSAGQMGLLHAARRWDPDRGVTFESFARTRIRGAMLDELRRRDWATRSTRADGRAAQAASADLSHRLGRTPTARELAAHLGVDVDDLHRVEADLHRATVMSLDGLLADTGAGEEPAAAGGDPLAELLGRELKGALAAAVDVLPERLRTVVVGYFFDERQMLDIAKELGVTESRVSQMRAEALALLKDGIASQLDPETLPSLSSLHGRVARRKATYYAAIAETSDFRTRLRDRHISRRSQPLAALSA